MYELYIYVYYHSYLLCTLFLIPMICNNHTQKHTALAIPYTHTNTHTSPTFKLHPDIETLLESAVGAALALRLVDDTVAVRHAGVHLLVLDGPLEEALAGLAGEEAVVVAGHLHPHNQSSKI